MALGETARLIASLELKDLFTKNINSAEKSLGKFDSRLDQTQSRAYRAGQQIGTGIRRGAAVAAGGIAFLAANLALGVSSLEKVEKVTTQTNAVLRSTHGVAGQTAQGIRDMANQFESLNATMDDTAIQSGANVLLTFTNIREKAFKPALQAALDLSTAMGQDLQSSVVQIGKALNDPIKGITALTRVGVTFDDQQKKQIKTLVQSGKTLDAQRIIIKELNREFGGSFIGQGNNTAGKIAKVRDAVDDLQRAFATAFLPVISRVADVTTKFLADPAVTRNIEKLGNDIAGLFSDQNITAGAEFLKAAFVSIKTAAPILEASAKATLGLIQAAVGVFKTLPAPIQGLLVGGVALNKLTGGLVTNIGGALIDLVGKSRGASPANPVFVAPVGPGALGGGAGGGLLGAAGGLASVVIPATLVAAVVAAVGDHFISQNQQDLSAKVDAALSGAGSFGDTKREIDALVREAQAGHLGDQQVNFLKSLQTRLDQGIRIDPQQLNQISPGAILDRGGREQGFNVLAGKIADSNERLIEAIPANISREFRGALETLRTAVDPKKVVSAIKTLSDVMVTRGHGSLEQTKETIAALTKRLRDTHDPTLQAALKSAIHDLKEKVPGREYAQRQIERMNRILGSSRSTEDKIRGLQAIERDLKDHKLPGQTQTLKARIDALKASQAAKAAETTRAIKEKDLSLALTVVSPPVNVFVNARTVFATQRRVERYYTNTGRGKG